MKYLRKTPPPGFVDVGRSTIYGNPFKKGKICGWCGEKHQYGGDTLECFQAYATHRMFADIRYKESVQALKNRKLWCPGCPIGSPYCHARILEKLSKSPYFK